MKKVLSVGFMIILMVIGISGCNNKNEKVGIERINENKKIVIGLDDSFPPMGFVNKNGELVGFDIDLAKAVGEELGIEVVFKPIEWDGIIISLLNKEIDLIWNGLTITDERKEKIGFSKAYLANSQIVVTMKESNIKELNDLDNKIIGAQLESSSSYAIEESEKINNLLKEVNYYPTNTEAFMDLQIGRIDALVVDEILGKYYIEKSDQKFEILKENLGEELYGIGLRKEDDTLKDEIDKAIVNLIKEGKAKEISEKWFGEDIILSEE